MQRAFEPFDEKDDPRYSIWEDEDETDVFIPPIQGFLTDYIYANRGREQASAYGVWSALFLISSIIQRDAWLETEGGDAFLDRDWLNMYIILIGPAGCGKSRAVDATKKILKAVVTNLLKTDNPYLMRKKFLTLAEVTTPEAMLHTMANFSQGDGDDRRVIVGKYNGETHQVNAHTNTITLLSEFSSMFGKQKYLESMSSVLLSLYDCPSVFDYATRGGGELTIPEIFFNLMGAATPDGMVESVNPTILQDGFMSRMIMVEADLPRARPIRFKTECTTADIVQRLQWIAENAEGGYKLSKKAEKYYIDWYYKFMADMSKNPEKAGYMIRNRGLILKIGALLKISEYTEGNEIEIKHLKAAQELINLTYAKVSDLINYMTDKQVGAAMKAIVTAASAEKGSITRMQIARRAKRFAADVVNTALQTLWLRGEITKVNNAGNPVQEGLNYAPAERYQYARATYAGKGFNPKPKADVLEATQTVVFGRDTSDEDSPAVEEESVGHLFGFTGSGD